MTYHKQSHPLKMPKSSKSKKATKKQHSDRDDLIDLDENDLVQSPYPENSKDTQEGTDAVSTEKEKDDTENVSINLVDIRCPITKEIMNDPVMCDDGILYERMAIEEWLTSSHASPVTGVPFKTVQLFPAVFAKNVITNYLKMHPEMQNDQYKPALRYSMHEATVKNYIKVHDFTKLLEYQAFDLEKMMTSKSHGRSYMDILTKKCKNDDVIKHIISNCIDLNATKWVGYDDYDGESRHVMYYFIKNCSLAILAHILTINSDDIEDSCGMKLSHYVCKYGTYEMVRHLTEVGTIDERDDYSNEPVYYLSENKRITDAQREDLRSYVKLCKMKHKVNKMDNGNMVALYNYIMQKINESGAVLIPSMQPNPFANMTVPEAA